MTKLQKTFVFLHGMAGSPADWQFFQGELKALNPEFVERNQFLNLTLGKSDSLAMMVASLAAQVSTQKLTDSEIVLCGYSMGGRFAILLAEVLQKIGRTPRALILVSANFGFSEPNQERTHRIQADEAWLQLWGKDQNLFWKTWYEQPIFEGYSEVAFDRRQIWEEKRVQVDSQLLKSHIQAFSPSQHPYLMPKLERLAGNKISLLYMVGERDKKYVALSQSVVSLPGADVRVAPNAAHILPLEQPKWLAENFLSFVNTL